MAEYRLLATWRFAVPMQPVFDAIVDSLQWPAWWPGADAVEQRVEGRPDGIGSVRHYTWKGRLPYRLRFDALTTRIVSPEFLEASISGDLEGVGRWTFSHQAGITTVHYEWHVHTTKLWMNLAAPAARRLFASNHHALMQQGADALAHRLGARLVESVCHELPAARHAKMHWPAVAVSGAAAGIVATIAQVILWWLAGLSPFNMLLRDTRLAAAIVLGPAVLPPPVALDWGIMLAATLVHFTLSLAYAALLEALTMHLNQARAIVAGCLFGLMLFGINMYGFTALFPWFEASRDWITAAAHAVFGMTAAATSSLWKAYAATLRQRQVV